MPPIRAVLFDFGLVLSGPPDPVARGRMETILNTTHPELREAYWRHREDYDLGVLSGVRFWRTVGAELGHLPSDEELAQLLEADVDLWTQPNQPMIDWATALQSADVTTGILSNMGDAMEGGIRARFPWLALVRLSALGNVQIARKFPCRRLAVRIPERLFAVRKNSRGVRFMPISLLSAKVHSRS